VGGEKQNPSNGRSPKPQTLAFVKETWFHGKGRTGTKFGTKLVKKKSKGGGKHNPWGKELRKSTAKEKANYIWEFRTCVQTQN